MIIKKCSEFSTEPGITLHSACVLAQENEWLCRTLHYPDKDFCIMKVTLIHPPENHKHYVTFQCHLVTWLHENLLMAQRFYSPLHLTLVRHVFCT